MSEMPERIAIRLNRAYNELDRRLEDGYLMAAFVISQERADLESAEGYESFVRADLVPKWIPVGERLPDTDRWVDVFAVMPDEKGIVSAQYSYGQWLIPSLWPDLPETVSCAVTHWREKPEYPTEGI